MEKTIRVPTVLLPKPGAILKKWAVVACDQYTSEPEYWKRVNDFVGDSPSTLNIIFPEVYLEEPNTDKRIKSINDTMRRYMDEFLVEKKGFVLVDRQLENGSSRKGLMICVDLEAYDYRPFTRAPIRATEGTVMDRLPPRIRIRKDACLESPHIMFLIDDKDKTVIEPLFNMTTGFEVLYDFELMEKGGHIRGYLISDDDLQKNILRRFGYLLKNDFLFAVGDGNHSLATAKEIWKKTSSALDESEKKNHPARFAMVEVVNVFDDGLVFEPIHRVLFNAPDFLDGMKISGSPSADKSTHKVEYIKDGEKGYIYFGSTAHNLPVGALQDAIDKYLEKNKSARVDYIHGEDVVRKLSTGSNIGLILKPMKKEELFRTVEKNGVLPRKTFSMGEANEKRYYLECRRIVL